MSLLFPSCVETARRLSAAQERPLRGGERVGVIFHLAICSFCRRYRRQLRFLRHAFGAFRSELEEMSDAQLSDEARQKIIQRLERE